MQKDKSQLQKEFINAPAEAFLKSDVVSAYINRSVAWLNGKAVSGGGIPFHKMGRNRLYKKVDVMNWVEQNCQRVKSTSEYTVAGRIAI